jgi:hypothetical protein
VLAVPDTTGMPEDTAGMRAANARAGEPLNERDAEIAPLPSGRKFEGVPVQRRPVKDVGPA